MGYYQGDFYRGAMRGDPGFFSFLGGLAKKAVSFIPGVGPAIKTAIDIIPTKKPVMAAGREILAKAGSTIAKHPVLSAAGAAGALAVGAGEAGRMGMFGRAAGKHPSARHMRALAMGLKRARPRMNVTNVHALRRALRRTHGFAKLAMKTIHLVHPKKHARFGGFRKRRKK